MRKVIMLIGIIMPIWGHCQIWQETFDGLANGTTSDAGATAWTTTLPSGGASSFSKQTPVTGYQLFLVNSTGTEGVWRSGVINISTHAEVAIEITLYSYFTFDTDYIRCYYKLNGGPEVQFGELQGSNGLNITSAASAVVSGSTVQIVVRGYDNTPGTSNTYGFPIPNALAFDDVTLTSIRLLYSRQSGNWNNGITWSTDGFDGASCSCTPDETSHVIIGNNRIVSIPAAVTAAGVTVQNTGRLQYTGNTSLTMARGGIINVAVGGTINNNGNNGATIVYNAFTYSTIVNGTLLIGGIDANSGSNVAFSGNGSVVVANDFIIRSGNGKNISFNTMGGFLIGGALNFPAGTSNVTATNQRTLTVGSITVGNNTSNGNAFNNTASGTLNVGAITLNNGDFTLSNAGIINQTGNFSGVDGGSAFRNLDGSTWNFSGGGTNTRLFCNNGTNTFNYNGSGAQSIFVPADAYSNLILSASGTKTASGNLDVNGNLTINGTSQLDVSASSFGISLAGNWVVTSSNGNPFIERSSTVTFDGTSNQSISTALGTETFYNLGVNKSSGNIILSNASPATNVTVSNNVSLTNGAIDLNGRTISITNSAASAIARTNGCIISETTTLPYAQVRWSVGTNTGAYIFPFGKSRASADYIPFTFNVTSAGTGSGTVAVATYGTSSNNTPFPSGVTDLYSYEGVDNRENVVDRFWNITLDSYTANPVVSVTFTATPAEVGTIGSLRAQRWNSVQGKWDQPIDGQQNPTLYSARVSGVRNFSPWTLSGNNVPLPIELVYFKASLVNDRVNIEWETSQEINNDFYTVERTTDFENYQAVQIIKGAGTSLSKQHYNTVDPNPLIGNSYYRLKQTDIDGTITYSKLVKVEFNGFTDVAFTVFPLPSNGKEVNLDVKGLKGIDAIPCVVSDLQGKVLYSAQLHIDNQRIQERVVFKQPLSPGIYIMRLGSTVSYSQKMIVK